MDGRGLYDKEMGADRHQEVLEGDDRWMSYIVHRTTSSCNYGTKRERERIRG